MHLSVYATAYGWQAADEDSIDGEIDHDGTHHYSGQYAHGKTRREALEELRDVYLDSDKLPETQVNEALAWVAERLVREYIKPDKADWLGLARALCSPPRELNNV